MKASCVLRVNPEVVEQRVVSVWGCVCALRNHPKECGLGEVNLRDKCVL